MLDYFPNLRIATTSNNNFGEKQLSLSELEGRYEGDRINIIKGAKLVYAPPGHPSEPRQLHIAQ